MKGCFRGILFHMLEYMTEACMKFYLIEEIMTECTADDIAAASVPFVAVVNSQEYHENKELFCMDADIPVDMNKVRDTKVIVNYDSLTGTLNIPDNFTFSGEKFKLGFIMDARGIVMIDNDEFTVNLVDNIRLTRKWRLPSLERFIYDFLEETIHQDPQVLENIQNDLDQIEMDIMKGTIEEYPSQLNDIRSSLLDLHMHYEHLIDLSKELEENENGFFKEENLRYFRLFADRVMRLQDTVTSLREYIVQLRNLIGEQLAIRLDQFTVGISADHPWQYFHRAGVIVVVPQKEMAVKKEESDGSSFFRSYSRM